MQEFLFYTKIGLQHVIDVTAYDHVLFLAALAIPFTFKTAKKIVLLATVFTITHCIALALSVYGIVVMDTYFIEIAILVSIILTAIFNLLYTRASSENQSMLLHFLVTAFFGAIHGFGFSNYFKMLMAEETNKLSPLFGFATGIEIAQIIIIALILAIAYDCQEIFEVKRKWFITIASILIIGITLPLLVDTVLS